MSHSVLRRAVVGLVLVGSVGVGLFGLWGLRGEVLAQHPGTYSATGSADDLIAIPHSMGERGQLLTVLDPRQKALAVYWVDGATGKVSLRSVRNVQYDMQLMDFNGDNPSPREIRTQLEQR